MRRRKESELLHRPQQLVAYHLRLIQRPGMNHLESHRADLRQVLERLAFSRNRRNAFADRRWVVGTLAARLANSLNSSFRQDRFRRHIQNPVLERSAADIWNQAFHYERI